MLEEEGVEVRWEPPEETRGADLVEQVVIGLLVNGASDAIKVGVRRFRERFARSGAEVNDEDDDEDDD